MITDEMREFKNIIKYKIDGFDILFENGDIESIPPGMINHLYIEKDFDVLYFPLINVSMAMKDTVYERINTSIYSKRILDSLGLYGAIRVSPLHCHGTDDIDAFLRITAEIARRAKQK